MTSGVYVRSEKCRKILSKSHRGKPSNNKGKKASIETRIKQSEAHKGIQNGKDNPFYGKQHTKETKDKMSKSHQGCIPWNMGLTKETNMIVKKISEFKIGKKHSEETKQKICKSREYLVGEKASNWQGGVSFLPYCKDFNKIRKEKVRERDDRICQECGKTELENGKKLTCHHIHYDKENCKPDLIALCVSCNSKANKNKDYWEEHFMNKLKERGLLC